MLKFFSARDDENESLLGEVTEGKGPRACTHTFKQADPVSLMLRRRVMIKNADTALAELLDRIVSNMRVCVRTHDLSAWM